MRVHRRSHTAWSSRSLLTFWLTILLALAGGAAGEIYKWTDSSGRVHFTQDLSSVPVAQRVAAESAAKRKPGPSRVQIYSPPAARQSSVTRPTSAKLTAASGKVYRIPVQPSGSSMSVQVRINRQLDVPFHIDTGATDVVLPSWAAKQLGLDLEDARSGVYGTANGIVKQKLVKLDSVSLQGAEVRNVPATVSKSMSYGLLGLSYFNHFHYTIDPVAGVVTLRRNQLAESGFLKGGRSRGQWRSHFSAAYRRIEAMEEQRDAVPFSKTRRRKEKEEEIERLRHELELLENEADDAKVPFGWRE